MEITTEDLLNRKIKHVRTIANELRRFANISINTLLVCENNISEINSLGFSDIEDKLEFKLYESFCSRRNSR